MTTPKRRQLHGLESVPFRQVHICECLSAVLMYAGQRTDIVNMVSFRDPTRLLSSLFPKGSFPVRWSILCPGILCLLMSHLEKWTVLPPFRIAYILGTKMGGFTL